MQSIQALTSLPQEIRSWLASEGTADQLRKINAELDLHEEETRLIPYLLFRLAVKDLEPLNFVETLSDWLDISPSSANTIASEIKDRILAPVAGELRSWGVEISLIKPIEMESRPPVVAPPPPLPSETSVKEGPALPPFQIKPEPAYEPPTPPAMGGRFDIGGAGATGGLSEKQPERKGRIHIIGDAHEHAEGESQIANGKSEPEVVSPRGSALDAISQRQSALGEEKKIKLPIPPRADEEAESKPLILHQETTILPVVKEQEWMPPKPKTAPPTESPRLDKKSPSEQDASSQRQSALGIASQRKSASEAPKGSLLPPSGIRVVHYDENVTPLPGNMNPARGEAREERQESRIKNKDEKLGAKKPEPPRPPHNKNQELMRPPSPPAQGGANIKGNTVDLR